jgi:hypothetical protein
MYDYDISKIKTSITWEHRNKYCQKHIKYMRENGKDSIEKNGPYKDLFTIDETILLLFMCSNLCRTEVKNVIKKIEKYLLFNNNKY